MTLNARSVSLTLGESAVLNNVSLQVAPGSIHVVVGPNGAGKSSLLKLLGGQYSPNQGELVLDGDALQNWPLQALARRMAFLPQQSVLNFPFTSEEVVALGRYPHSSGDLRDREIVSEALTSVGGGEMKHRLYTSLSGGEQQRVHLARVLAQIWEPSSVGERYLLLDEPTAALDMAHQHMILQLARSLSLQGVGVLSVLHDLNLAAQYADVISLLDRGKVVAQGPPEDVLTSPIIQNVYKVKVEIMRHPTQDRFLIVSE